ncbi:septum formation initiator family protein [Carnobacteriaceae bacterium zg-ZUI252]|nr:septum formation initiator family protein [Carnobacteriaceae bacterium zg-ZUI252]MBS4770101.1 septum formation initiator family protein [Carnobacteriaceae bacterium zg-ZUI240]QTU82885.1 septum formation initiator family protein [Carnobacteriaceae bacterium zg-C25]
METTESKRSQQRKSNRVFLWLLGTLLFAATLCFQIFNNVQQTEQLKKNLEIVKVENQQAKTRQIELKTYVDLLNDDEYVLKLARARGFYTLPNELIFNIPEENAMLQNEQARQKALSNQGE